MIVFDPRRIDEPRPGYFMIRLHRYGPWLPAELAGNGEEMVPLLCGAPWEPQVDQSEQDLVDKIWCWGREITKAEHDRMVRQYRSAMFDAPETPIANPDRGFPPGKMPLRSLMP